MPRAQPVFTLPLKTAKVTTQTDPSNPRALEWADVPESILEDGQVLVKVKAADISRADLLRATGYYPPPKGVTDVLGLEYAGVIGEVKDDSQGWKVDDGIRCLLSGDVYAEKIIIPVGQIPPLSHSHSFIEATPIVEVAYTVFSNVVMIAGLKEDDLLLIHGSAGGTGTSVIQMTKRFGVHVAITVGSAEKLTKCRELGTDILTNYKEEDSTEIVAAKGGANIILDIMGARYLNRNVKTLAKGDHLAIIGMQGGAKGKFNAGRLLNKRDSVTITGLCYRDLANKARAVNAAEDTIWPMSADGIVTPQIHEVVDMRDTAKARELLDSGAVSGKVVLTV